MGRIYDSCIRYSVLHSFVSAMTNMVLYSSTQKNVPAHTHLKWVRWSCFQYYKKFGSTSFPYKYIHMKMHVCVSYIRCAYLSFTHNKKDLNQGRSEQRFQGKANSFLSLRVPYSEVGIYIAYYLQPPKLLLLLPLPPYWQN